MAYDQVAIIVGLILLGAAGAYWPCSLKIAWQSEQIDGLAKGIAALKADLKRGGEAADSVVSLERDLDTARDLVPADELGVLLDEPPAGPESPARSTGSRQRRVG